MRTRGAQTRGPREIQDFVGWEMARGKGPPRSGDATGRIRGPHEACFVGWIGARGPVGLSSRTSSVVSQEFAGILRLRRSMPASGGPALRRHASSDALLLVPPPPWPRPPDRHPSGACHNLLDELLSHDTRAAATKGMGAEQDTGAVVQLHPPGSRERPNCENKRYTGLADVILRGRAISTYQADLLDLGSMDAAAGASDALVPPGTQVGPRHGAPRLPSPSAGG